MPEFDPVPEFDIAAVRKRFTALSGDFVFLDAPGGTQVPAEVGEAVARAYREASGNTGAPYATSARIEGIVEESRAASARFLGCAPDEVIFGASSPAITSSSSGWWTSTPTPRWPWRTWSTRSARAAGWWPSRG